VFVVQRAVFPLVVARRGHLEPYATPSTRPLTSSRVRRPRRATDASRFAPVGGRQDPPHDYGLVSTGWSVALGV